MRDLKQSTARVVSFFMVSSTDHLSAKTSAAPTVNISKNGGAFGAAAGAVAELTNGWYTVSLTTVDTGTLGDLAFHITGTGADDTDFADQVVAIDLQDGAALGLSRIDATISSRSTYAGGAVASVTAAVTVGTNNDKTGYTLTAGEHTSITADVWDSARSSHTTAGTFGQGVASVQGNVTGSVGSVTGAVGSVTGAVGSVTAGVTVTTNNDKTGYGLSAAAVQAVWDALTSALTTVGSIGKLLVDNINATISSRSTYAGADTAGTTTLLSRLTGTRATNLDNLDATVSSRSTYAGGAVASVTGNVGGSIGSVAAGGIVTSSFGVGAIDNVAFSQGAADRVLASVVEGTVTLKQSTQLANAANAGIVAGAATTSVTIKGMDDSTTRVAATVDADGNRTSVTRTYS